MAFALCLQMVEGVLRNLKIACVLCECSPQILYDNKS